MSDALTLTVGSAQVVPGRIILTTVGGDEWIIATAHVFAVQMQPAQDDGDRPRVALFLTTGRTWVLQWSEGRARDDQRRQVRLFVAQYHDAMDEARWHRG